MTRARRITQGERTQSAIDLLPKSAPRGGVEIELAVVDEFRDLGTDPLAASPQPERMCKACEGKAEHDLESTELATAYGVVVAPSGLGHYTADDTTTLCGRDYTDWPTT